MTPQTRFSRPSTDREKPPLPVAGGTIALGAPRVGTHRTIERKTSREEMAEVDR